MYSEMIGSFIRTGNYPLEANYYFDTEAALIEFYRDPINRSTLHKGLLKVVGDLDLYWVVVKDGELYFKKLISINTIESIDDLKNKILNLTAGDEDLKDELESLAQLIEDLAQLLLEVSNAEILKKIIGNDDIANYLDTIPYNSLAVISKVLDDFFNTVDEENASINTFKELQNFLNGYSNADTLERVLQELISKLKGNVSDKFDTLEKVQEFIEALSRKHKHDTNNLQTELDQTLVGVGLSGDGSYNSDKETYYLQDATSVMNALKTLDALIHELSEKATLIVEEASYKPDTEELVMIFRVSETETTEVRIPASDLIEEWAIENPETSVVKLTKTRSVRGKDILSADIRISDKTGNKLSKDGNALYVGVPTMDIEYEAGSLKVLTDGRVSKVIPLVDKLLVSPVLNVIWEVTNQDGNIVNVIPNINARDIVLEKGYKVKGTFNFKWTRDSNKKDPTSTSGVCGATLPDSGILSDDAIVENIISTLTFTLSLYAPKSGFMVSGSSVIAPSGNDVTSAKASVTFLSRVYYGVSTSNNPSITSLSNNRLQNGKGATLSGISTTPELYWSYAYPKSLGTLIRTTLNGTAPVLEDFNRAELTITNSAGLPIDYYIYTSKNRGAFTNVELKFE